MEQGWIKLHRRVLENTFLMHDDKAFSVFMKLLMMVGKEKGQWSGGRHQLGELVNINPRTLYDVLIRLEDQHLINIESNNRYSIITVVNWSKYQATPTAEPTASQQPTNNQPTTNQHSNKKKKEKKNIAFVFPELEPELTEFMKMRRAIKSPMTDKAVQLLVSKLTRMYPDDVQSQKACLEQSVENGWKSVYELKQPLQTSNDAALRRKARHEALIARNTPELL